MSFSAITHRYPRFSILTLRWISIKNLLTAGGNLYNSFIILTNLQNFQENVFSWNTSGGCFWKATSRSSRLEVFHKKGVHRNFTNFTGKHLCWSFKALGLFFLYPLFLQPYACNFIKTESLIQVLSCEFVIGIMLLA